MHYLLIHGSWHGAWCWHKIATRLRAEGHRVTVPDLPGRGEDRTRPIFIGMKTMLKRLMTLAPKEEKTVVVVHSRYGVLASELAEAAPERIARTIYLASFMLPPGGMVARYAAQDRASQIPAHLEVNRLAGWDWFRQEAHREVLYHDCHEDDATLATGLLRREPSRPAITRLGLTDGRYGSVPRAYIRLTQDRAVSPALQDRLIEETGADRVESLAAGHSAYFSQPDALASTIGKLAAN